GGRGGRTYDRLQGGGRGVSFPPRPVRPAGGGDGPAGPAVHRRVAGPMRGTPTPPFSQTKEGGRYAAPTQGRLARGPAGRAARAGELGRLVRVRDYRRGEREGGQDAGPPGRAAEGSVHGQPPPPEGAGLHPLAHGA